MKMLCIHSIQLSLSYGKKVENLKNCFFFFIFSIVKKWDRSIYNDNLYATHIVMGKIQIHKKICQKKKKNEKLMVWADGLDWFSIKVIVHAYGSH